MKTRLQELRKAAGYRSAESFAERMGIKVKTLRNYEQGVTDFSLDFACNVCNVLGCTLDELVGREVDPVTGHFVMTLNTLDERDRGVLAALAEQMAAKRAVEYDAAEDHGA